MFNYRNVTTQRYNANIITRKKDLNYAEMFLDGKLIVQDGLEPINISENMSWNYQHSKSPETYILYLHTLKFIKNLTYAYIVSKREIYIENAYRYLMSWIKENHYKESLSERVWYDHTVSSRIQNILYFQINAPENFKIEEKILNEILERHLEFLVNINNYHETNHGIMMDRAVLRVCEFIAKKEDKKKYLNVAKSRIEKAILRDYSYRYVHSENSPAYHIMVTQWLINIADLLEDLGSPLKIKYVNILKKAKNLNSIMINYNQEYPLIGDTSYVKTNITKSHKDFVDYQAGLAIINDEHSESSLHFNCGYMSKGHKHLDDLSFTLSINSENIIVDSGKYNHSKNDPIRKYMVSPAAHSTLYVKNKVYSLDSFDNIKLLNYLNFGNFKYTSGIHQAYNGVTLKRVIVSIKGTSTIIIDKVQSDIEENYVQNFIFDEKINVENIDNNKYKIRTPKNREYFMEEHSQRSNHSLLSGKKNKAYISKSFNNLSDTKKLEYRKKTRKSIFITSILPRGLEISNLKFDTTIVRFKLNGKIIRIPIY